MASAKSSPPSSAGSTSRLKMAEDAKTLWIGSLDEKVTEQLLYELFLQTGPIDRLIFPSDGEGENKRHKGQAYIVFRHAETVQYATQILDGSSLFSVPLTMKARNLPVAYKSTSPTGGSTYQGNKGRFDNNTLRTGFNKATTWHGQSDLVPRGRGNFRNRGGGVSNVTQNTGYNAGYNNYNNQANTGYWTGEQQNTGGTQTSYNTNNNSMDDRRQKLGQQQQNQPLDAHRQVQQGNVSAQVYGLNQQQSSDQQQTQGGMWTNTGYSAGSWNTSSADGSNYVGYTTDQYGNWYQQQ